MSVDIKHLELLPRLLGGLQRRHYSDEVEAVMLALYAEDPRPTAAAAHKRLGRKFSKQRIPSAKQIGRRWDSIDGLLSSSSDPAQAWANEWTSESREAYLWELLCAANLESANTSRRVAAELERMLSGEYPRLILEGVISPRDFVHILHLPPSIVGPLWLPWERVPETRDRSAVKGPGSL